MLSLFTRPSRRPRTVRRNPARPVLRVEALETRANPSTTGAPTFVAVQTTWTDATDVVIKGTVADANPSSTFISATASGSVSVSYANSSGGFQVSLHTDGSSPVSIQAHDSQGLNSDVVTNSSGVSLLQVTPLNSLGLNNVQIVYENGGWHIRGTVTGGTAGQTVITIVSTIPGNDGTTSVVENADGSFDIGINMDAGSPGGTISITGKDTSTGNVSDTWDGFVS
jgi:hypothetical protein